MNYNVHPAADAFPMMSDAELKELADDITTHGLRNPVVLNHDGTVLIDGRNRLRACQIAGLEPTYTNLPELTDQQIIDHIVSANIHRRHLSQGQRATVATALEPMYAEAARERMLAGKKDPLADSREGSARENWSSEQAAKAVGASGRSVSDAKALKRDAPDLFDKVVNGEMTLNAADKERKERKARAARATQPGAASCDQAGRNPILNPPSPITFDAAVAYTRERIRIGLWRAAGWYWWDHYGKEGEKPPYPPPFSGESRIAPAMIVAWRNAIERGLAQPVTKPLTIPEAEWIGLGLSPADDEDDWDAWCHVMSWACGSGEGDGDDLRWLKSHLERRWVDDEVARRISEVVGNFFDEDGDFIYNWCEDDEDDREETIMVPTPRHLFDELIFKVDEAAQDAVDRFGEDDDQ